MQTLRSLLNAVLVLSVALAPTAWGYKQADVERAVVAFERVALATPEDEQLFRRFLLNLDSEFLEISEFNTAIDAFADVLSDVYDDRLTDRDFQDYLAQIPVVLNERGALAKLSPGQLERINKFYAEELRENEQGFLWAAGRDVGAVPIGAVVLFVVGGLATAAITPNDPNDNVGAVAMFGAIIGAFAGKPFVDYIGIWEEEPFRLRFAQPEVSNEELANQ
ncbi:MAG: hypothetical protein HRT45_14435 [Bdellovibrionales bacterium]|nr:hypothetical protein [Bdellovibrionales bacterium]